MNNKKRCILCGDKNFRTLFHVDKAPKNIQGLLVEKELDKDKTISFDLIQCKKCDMIQLGDFDILPRDYYDDYIMTQSFSKQNQEYLMDISTRFVKRFNLFGKKLFEIGSGDGEFLLKFKEQGLNVVGIEPSLTFSKRAEKGLVILKEYFNKNTTLKEKSFDAIVSRAVFEHLKNPHSVLEGITKVLKESGVGLIEVPNFEKSIKERRYYDVFSDHVAYYTKKTLIKLLELHNFEIVEIFNTFNDEFLVVFFRKNQNYSVNKFIKDFAIYKKDFRKTLDKLKKENKTIAFWGAGGKGNAILSLCDIRKEEIKHVIDSDINKIGKHTIGTHIKIVSPSILYKEKIDTIIITAMAFASEIIQDLKSKYNYKGRIFVISPKLTEVIL